jgi:hypothetical protein
MDIKEIIYEDVTWIQLAQHIVQRQGRLKSWLIFGLYEEQEISWLEKRIFASRKGLYSMQLV